MTNRRLSAVLASMCLAALAGGQETTPVVQERALSCSPFRIPVARLAAARAQLANPRKKHENPRKLHEKPQSCSRAGLVPAPGLSWLVLHGCAGDCEVVRPDQPVGCLDSTPRATAPVPIRG